MYPPDVQKWFDKADSLNPGDICLYTANRDLSSNLPAWDYRSKFSGQVVEISYRGTSYFITVIAQGDNAFYAHPGELEILYSK